LISNTILLYIRLVNENNLRSKLRLVLQEGFESPIPEVTLRDMDMDSLLMPPIVAVIGARRAGKTWLCYQAIRTLLARGIPRECILYVNLEDERLHPLTGSELTELLDAHRELYSIPENRDIHCFIDEIQNASNWSKWVRRITDQNPRLHIVVTGSSAKMLSSEIATELRGRAKTIVVYPYSWREYLTACGWEPEKIPDILHSPKKPDLRRLYHDFENLGGFPGIRKTLDPRETLQEYYRTMFTRDIIERFAVKNVPLFEDFLKLHISRFSALSSVSNLEKELKTFGHRCSKQTLMNYLGFAREVHLLFEISLFNNKVKNQLLYPRKVYGIDQGLLNAIRFSTSEDKGRILENMVFLELKRRKNEVFYFADKNECDFVIRDGMRTTQLIQVCFQMHSPKTRKRAIAGLVEAMNKLECRDGLILTDDEYEDIEENGKTIPVRPFWFWALARQTSVN
jgi:uncharacterized protein